MGASYLNPHEAETDENEMINSHLNGIT